VWVLEVANYAIHQRATGALAAAQLRLGQDLCGMEPGFPPELSFDHREEPVGDFTTAAEAILGELDVQDIIHNAPPE